MRLYGYSVLFLTYIGHVQRDHQHTICIHNVGYTAKLGIQLAEIVI